MIRLWNRLVSLPTDRLTRKVFMWDKNNNHPWSREVSEILNNSDFYLFGNNLQCNLKYIKEKMFIVHKEKWRNDLLSKPKLRNYILFKSDYVTEPYVTLKLSRRQRSLCAQLRAGTLPLAIEVGRFKGIPEERRLCEFCDLHVVEDEFHFILYCPLFDELRNCLFKSAELKNADIFWKSEGDIVNWLFGNDVFALARYIDKAWTLRQSILYPMD